MSRRPKCHAIDFYLFFSIICLLVIGMLMVFSASSVSAYNQYNNPYYFFQRQMIWAVLGIAVMLVVSGYDYYKLKKVAFSGYT
jgi:cell division protein FtsW